MHARARGPAARRGGSCRRSSSAARRTRSGGSACTARGARARSARIDARGLARRLVARPPARRTPSAPRAAAGPGDGTTAASATAACSISTLSSSNGRDPVVGRLEHVVGAADVGDVAVLVAASRRRRCGSSRRASPRRCARRRRGSRPSARAGGAARSRQISPSSAGLAGDRVEQRDRVAGQRPAHRAGLDRLAGRVADLQRSSRSGRSRRGCVRPQACCDLLDDLGVERLAGADDLAQRRRAAAPRSAWISIRHTVGGAQKRGHAAAVPSRPAARPASKRA